MTGRTELSAGLDGRASAARCLLACRGASRGRGVRPRRHPRRLSSRPRRCSQCHARAAGAAGPCGGSDHGDGGRGRAHAVAAGPPEESRRRRLRRCAGSLSRPLLRALSRRHARLPGHRGSPRGVVHALSAGGAHQQAGAPLAADPRGPRPRRAVPPAHRRRHLAVRKPTGGAAPHRRRLGHERRAAPAGGRQPIDAETARAAGRPLAWVSWGFGSADQLAGASACAWTHPRNCSPACAESWPGPVDVQPQNV